MSHSSLWQSHVWDSGPQDPPTPCSSSPAHPVKAASLLRPASWGTAQREGPAASEGKSACLLSGKLGPSLLPLQSPVQRKWDHTAPRIPHSSQSLSNLCGPPPTVPPAFPIFAQTTDIPGLEASSTNWAPQWSTPGVWGYQRGESRQMAEHSVTRADWIRGLRCQKRPPEGKGELAEHPRKRQTD